MVDGDRRKEGVWWVIGIGRGWGLGGTWFCFGFKKRSFGSFFFPFLFFCCWERERERSIYSYSTNQTVVFGQGLGVNVIKFGEMNMGDTDTSRRHPWC